MLKKTGIVKKLISLYSPINGFVIEKKAIGGQRIMPGENIYKIADLSTVWIVGDVYQKDLAWVRINQPVRIIISYIPGEEFQGTISFIYPYLNETTGTNKVRIEVQNKGYKLKPGMYANLEFTLSIGEKLVIPSEAVLDSGEVKYAFLDKGNGFFEPKIIKVGISGDDYYEIISGLKEGDKVITDAAFLIDSESSIKAAISQMMNGEHKH
jgi:Cu(I)/Ag(I) efflux system membrane fusion protein